jgi:hypothetical protein
MSKRQAFFSEEKKQKTLLIREVRSPARSATALEKVFWFFSSEKNACLLSQRHCELV